nr:uncharacterized protein LOC112940651 [Solanum lycopersicum]
MELINIKSNLVDEADAKTLMMSLRSSLEGVIINHFGSKIGEEACARTILKSEEISEWMKVNYEKPSILFVALKQTLVKKHAPSVALNVEKGSTSKPQGGQKKKKSHKAKTTAPLTGGVKKSKGKCFHCKMSGHWKAHCPVFLAKKKNKPGVSRNAQSD